MKSVISRGWLRRGGVWLGLAGAAVSASGCNVLIGLNDYVDCSEPGASCTKTGTGGSGGSGGTGSTTSSVTTGGGGSGTGGATTTSSSSSSTTSSETGGTGGMPPMPTCTDNVKNGMETGKDCGGPCPPCADGEGCVLGTDCTSLQCVGLLCVPASCTDAVKNGTETDLNCGGGACPPCGDGKVCAVEGDCVSGVCTGGMCAAATCSDMVKNGAESDMDCGGGTCSPCAPGLVCGGAADCESAICQANKCVDYRVWGKRFGDAENQEGLRVTTDLIGESVVLGHFLGQINFTTSALGGLSSCSPDPMDPSYVCEGDYAIATRKADGTQGWSRKLVSISEYLEPREFVLDALDSSKVLVAGSGNGPIDIGGGMLNPPGSCGPNCGAGLVVGMLGTNGSHKWSKRFDNPTGSATVAVGDTALAKSESSVTVGWLSGSVDFGGGTLTSTSYDVVALKLNSTGGFVWNKRFGGTGQDCAQAVAVDATENVFLAGVFEGTINFGGPAVTSVGGRDFFLTKLNAQGNHVWSKRFGDIANQGSDCRSGSYSRPKVATDAAGSVVLSGFLNGTVDFGGGPLTKTGNDSFIAKFDLSGTYLWSYRLPEASVSRATFDSTNAVIITGTATGPLTFGSTTLGGTGGFVVKLAADGSYLWGVRPTGVQPRSVAASTTGHLLLTGALYTPADFGGATLVSAGGSDLFIAKIVNP